MKKAIGYKTRTMKTGSVDLRVSDETCHGIWVTLPNYKMIYISFFDDKQVNISLFTKNSDVVIKHGSGEKIITVNFDGNEGGK